MKYIHKIKLEDNDDFCKRFNEISCQLEKIENESLSEQQHEQEIEIFMQMKYCLEQGIG